MKYRITHDYGQMIRFKILNSGKPMTETRLQSEILRALGSHPDVRMFRNTVGQAWMGRATYSGSRVTIEFPKRVTFGLCPGSGDLIGFRSYEVRPEDVGRRLAVFTSVEVKTPRGATQDNQITWRDVLRERGGIAIIARSPDEAMHGVLDWRLGV